MIHINLLPKEMLKREEKKGLTLLIGSAVVLIVLVLVGILVMLKTKEARLKNRLVDVTRKLDDLQPVLAQIQQLEANKAALDRKLNVIKDLERIRLLYPKFLTDLNLQLSKNIWLTSVMTATKADGLDLTISAKALDAYSIADQISRMEASGRFKNIEVGPIGTGMQDKQKVLTFTLTCRHLL